MSDRSKSGHGLIIGKFLPPHAGHLHLVDEAMRLSDSLTILVCTLANEPIPGDLRAEWMRELCPNANVVHVTDENPSEPHEHEDFWRIWIDTIRRHVESPIDVVFSSENYGEELARRLGASARCVDLSRERFPISGSAIRSDPYSHWRLLPPPVRAHYARRVVLTGSECTGKTTLAKRLAERYDTVTVREFGREYVDAQSRAPVFGDIEPIAQGQIASEDAAARLTNRVLFLDTDLLSTLVYSRHYFGDAPPWLEPTVRDRRPDLYLLCDIDVPWEADGFQRDRGGQRASLQKLFHDEVVAQGGPWIDLRGTVDERLERAAGAIDGLLRGSA